MSKNSSTSDHIGPWALVTGASAGIGADFCHQLASRGYNLVLVARRADRLRALSIQLEKQYNIMCRCHPLDLSLPTASAELADQLGNESIQIEFLVNNAGYGLTGHFTSPAWEDHARFIQVMMTAVCELTWRLLPAMQKARRGYVINVASMAGLVPGTAGHTLYAASKSFLIGFSQSLALENLHHDVKVSALCPGFTYSEFHDVSGTRKLVSKMPSWMWMKADEVAAYGIESVMRTAPRVVAIPGRLNRWIVRLVRSLPDLLSYKLTQRMSSRYRHQH